MPEDLKDALWKLVAAPVLKFQGKLRTGDTTKCKKNGTDILRTQPHGLEWRVLPSFIINEEITQAVLCTTYAIVKSYFNGGLPNTSGKTAYSKLSLYEPYSIYIDKFVELFVKPEEETSLLENRDILREWRMSKLNKKPSVIITCSDGELEKFFTPLYVKLNDTVRVKIQFGPDQYITTYNFPDSNKEDLRKFAKKHFIEFQPPDRIAEVAGDRLEERAPIPPTRGGRDDHKLARYDFAVFLPIFWNPKDIEVAESMFLELKDIIKDAILTYDKSRRG
jgi:hypothetical protein